MDWTTRWGVARSMALLGARLGAVLGMLALGACAAGGGGPADGQVAGGGGTCSLKPVAELAMLPVAPVPLVRVGINGQEAIMVLDTGAQGVFVVPEAAERLGLHASPGLLGNALGIGGSEAARGAILNRLTLGSTELHQVKANLLAQTLPIRGVMGVDGLLGMSVLDHYDIDLDMKSRKATLYAGDACATSPPHWAGMQRLEARSLNGVFVIPVRLDGRELNAMIDSGAEADVLFTDARGIAMARNYRLPGQVLRGVGPHMTDAFVARFAQLDVGGETMRGVPVVVTQRRAGTPDMILGQSFLARHRVWFSAQRRALFVAAASD